MNIGDKPVFPTSHQPGSSAAGLTKREHFAALAMQGLCARNAYAESPYATIADMAYKQADAMLAARENEA